MARDAARRPGNPRRGRKRRGVTKDPPVPRPRHPSGYATTTLGVAELDPACELEGRDLRSRARREAMLHLDELPQNLVPGCRSLPQARISELTDRTTVGRDGTTRLPEDRSPGTRDCRPCDRSTPWPRLLRLARSFVAAVGERQAGPDAQPRDARTGPISPPRERRPLGSWRLASHPGGRQIVIPVPGDRISLEAVEERRAQPMCGSPPEANAGAFDRDRVAGVREIDHPRLDERLPAGSSSATPRVVVA